MIAGIIMVCGRSFSRLLLSEHQPWGHKHDIPPPFLPHISLLLCVCFCAPQGQEQVHDRCFEQQNRVYVENLKIFHHVFVQQNILETRRQSLHSRTRGCASGIDARISVHSPCSTFFFFSFPHAQLSWQLIWGKWNANRAAEFASFSPSQQLQQKNRAHLEYFYALTCLETSMNHESVRQTKRSAILRGLRPESGSIPMLKLLTLSKGLIGKKEESTNTELLQSVFYTYLFFLTLSGLDTASKGFGASSPRETLRLQAEAPFK